MGSAQAPKKTPTVINPPPTAQDWADIAKLPDWSGVWNPKITDQDAQVKTNPPPWNEAAARKVEQMFAEEKAGRPRLIFANCLPEAHPSWMLVTHNAMEILFTPGRVTMLGESDGNRIRRIYTDGRGHPEASDPTFHGHSIGHWEGDTLVVDTVGIQTDAFTQLDRFEEARPFFCAFLLDDFAAAQHDVFAFVVDLNDLEVVRVADELLKIFRRDNINL